MSCEPEQSLPVLWSIFFNISGPQNWGIWRDMGDMGDMARYSGIQQDTAGYGGYSGIQRDTAGYSGKQWDTAGYHKNILQSTGEPELRAESCERVREI